MVQTEFKGAGNTDYGDHDGLESFAEHLTYGYVLPTVTYMKSS